MTAHLKTIRLRRRIVKHGDQTDVYRAGERLILKWQKEWIVRSVIYNPLKNETSINLFI